MSTTQAIREPKTTGFKIQFILSARVFGALAAITLGKVGPLAAEMQEEPVKVSKVLCSTINVKLVKRHDSSSTI